MLTRRNFLKTGSAALTALVAPAALLRAGAASAAGPQNVLVALFLRGGADALNLVVPYGDPLYYESRPTLAIPAGSTLNLDGFFGFHPSLRPLHALYRAGKLAVVHACGSPDDSRSHFDAQDFMESAAPGNRLVRSGWLGRYAETVGIDRAWAAVTFGARPARALSGTAPSLAFPSLAEFGLLGSDAEARRSVIEAVGASRLDLYARTAGDAFEALDVIETVDTTPRAAYPETPLAGKLRDVAALVRARIGLRVAAVDMDGWDHHFDEEDKLPERATELAGALSAFVADLGSDLDRTLVLVMSEFGRRIGENGSGGTEHGRAGAMLALGGAVRGGRVLLRNDRWPGLTLEDLADLAVTTDFRDVFAEALRRHMGVSELAPIFPGHAWRFPGLLG